MPKFYLLVIKTRPRKNESYLQFNALGRGA